MKTAFLAAVWLASALLVPCCDSSASSASPVKGQLGHLLLEGKRAEALLTKDADRLTLTITSRRTTQHPPNWSELRVSASCWPVDRRFGGFSCDMALINTNTVKGNRPTAVFAFKGDPRALEQISDVMVTDGPGRDAICYFLLPLSREEVLARFRARASKAELRQLQELRLARDLESQQRALELVLFKLTPSELFRIGVSIQIQVTDGVPTHDSWDCAWADSGEISDAVSVVLSNARIGASCSGNLGICHWFAPREQFFRARKALLAAKDPRVRSCAAQPPQFSFE